MKNVILFSFLVLAFNLLNAQSSLKSKNDITNHSDKVIKHMEAFDFQNAFSELQKYWPLPENEIVQFETQTIKQFNMISQRFGESIGSGFVKDLTLKDYAIKKIYVLRFEKAMVRVVFTYYQSKEGWILNGFKWDDEVGELFE